MNLKIDSGISSVVSSKSQVYKNQLKFDKVFGGSEYFVVLLENKKGIDSLKGINLLNDISNLLAKVIKNRSGKDVFIQSLTSIAVASNDFDYPLKSQKDLDTIIEVGKRPLFKGVFLNDKQTKTIVLAKIPIQLSNNLEKLTTIVDDFEAESKKLLKGNNDFKISVNGVPYIKSVVVSFITKDFMMLFPIAIVLFFVIILLLYRSLFSALVSVAITGMTISVVFALKSLLHSPVTIVESSIPIFLIAISSASSMHVLLEIIKYSKNYDMLIAPEKASKHLQMPVILSGVTTAIGFASLAFAETPSIRNMGIFLAIGILISTYLSLYFVPILASYKSFRNIKIHEKKNDHKYEKVLNILKKFSPLILILVVFELIFSYFGAINTKSELNEINYFKKDLPVRITAESLQKDFYILNNLQVIIKYKDEYLGKEKITKDELKSGKILIVRKLDELSKLLEKDKDVHKVVSFVSILKDTYKNLGKDFTLPEDDRFLNRLIMMLEKITKTNEGTKVAMESYVSADMKQYSTDIFIKSSEKVAIDRVVSKIKPILENLPENMEYKFIGAYLKSDIANSIIRDQMISLIFSVIMIYLLLVFVFRSIIDSFIVIIPISLSIFLNFGIMWILGIKLNPATAVISSIGMGVGVDYAIHFYYRLKNISKVESDVLTCINTAFRESFKGIFINAVAVMFGFSILMFSAYEITSNMGLIISLTMLSSSSSTLILLPVLFYHLRIWQANRKK